MNKRKSNLNRALEGLVLIAEGYDLIQKQAEDEFGRDSEEYTSIIGPLEEVIKKTASAYLIEL
jgi:hypothetical protein